MYKADLADTCAQECTKQVVGDLDNSFQIIVWLRGLLNSSMSFCSVSNYGGSGAGYEARFLRLTGSLRGTG